MGGTVGPYNVDCRGHGLFGVCLDCDAAWTVQPLLVRRYEPDPVPCLHCGKGLTIRDCPGPPTCTSEKCPRGERAHV